MSPICTILRTSFDDYIADALPAPQRRILREHLGACPECRSLAAAHDPTFLFSRPVREEVSTAEAGAILSNVRTGVALMEAERRINRTSRRRFAGVAAAAAVAALVLTMRAGSPRPGPEVAALPAPAPAPVATAEPTGLAPAALPAEAAAPSSDATIYNWNPGAGREEPRVVWIVDRGLDI